MNYLAVRATTPLPALTHNIGRLFSAHSRIELNEDIQIEAIRTLADLVSQSRMCIRSATLGENGGPGYDLSLFRASAQTLVSAAMHAFLPHRSLGPGIPGRVQAPPVSKHAAQLSSVSRVTAKPILGGLHHEYEWAEAA